MVRPVIFVSNNINSTQGGEDTYTYMQMDNFCVNGTLVATAEPGSVKSIRIYPNPTSESISIEFPSIQLRGMNLRISAIDGQIVSAKKIEPGQSVEIFDAKHLINGMYFIQIHDKNRIVFTGKFVKQ